MKRREKDEDEEMWVLDQVFPRGMHDCRTCFYFRQARSDPEHALTVCPVCGLNLLPQEKPHEPFHQ